MLTNHYHNSCSTTNPRILSRTERRAELVKVCRRLAFLGSLEADEAPTRNERARITRLVVGCDEEIRVLLAAKE